MRRIAPLSALLAVLVVVAAVTTWRDYIGFRTASMVLDAPLRFEVHPGESARAVLQRLQFAGLTRFDWRWKLLLRLEPATFRAGEYDLEPGLTPRGLLALLSSGRVVQYRFTLVDGWTWRQLQDALLSHPVLLGTPDQLATDGVMAALGSEEAHPEGWFLPETYSFVRGDSALDVLGRAHRAMRAALDEAWTQRALGLPLANPYEMLVLASIVEKESALESERADIAGVFIRRLQQGWRLETDPTVIYGLGARFDGDLRRRDLDADTPWNTYTRHGLPPTPIAMPGRSALLASARPAGGTAMFFVADGQGGHVFSDTLEAHNRAVQQLIRKNHAQQP